MARVTRSSKRAAAAAIAPAPAPATAAAAAVDGPATTKPATTMASGAERNALDSIDTNSTPEPVELPSLKQGEAEQAHGTNEPEEGDKNDADEEREEQMAGNKENSPAKKSKKKKKKTKRVAAKKSPVSAQAEAAVQPIVDAQTVQGEEPVVQPASMVEEQEAPVAQPAPVVEEQVEPAAQPVSVVEEQAEPAAQPVLVVEEQVEPAARPALVVEEQETVSADQSPATVQPADTQDDAVTDEHDDDDDDDDDAAVSAELQRMAQEMHDCAPPTTHADEAHPHDAEPPRPQTPAPALAPEQHETVSRPAKTPKFDPAIHGVGDGAISSGDDSFELHVSPRKQQPPGGDQPGPIQKLVVRPKKPTAPASTKPRPETATKPATVVKKKAGATTERANAKKKASVTANSTAKRRPVSVAAPPKRASSVGSQTSSGTAPRRVASVSSQASDAASTASTAVVIPHSKPRPITMAFPPPPPPTKSSKPPTKSNFELPGEVFARKIAAQKEERRKRMEEEEKRRREFKARPAPSSTFAKPSTREATPENKGPSTPSTRPVKRPSIADLPQKAAVAATTRTSPPRQQQQQQQQQDRDAQAQAVLKARREAAERGRQTVRMWAEQQKQKEQKAKAAVSG